MSDYDREYYEDFMNELMLDEYLMEQAMEKETEDYNFAYEDWEQIQAETYEY